MPVVVQQSTPSAATSSSQGRSADGLLETFQREAGDRPADSVLALRWLGERYRQVWASVPWEFARKADTLQTVDDITSDSVTVTINSTTVTETTSDSKWTSAVIGRKFRATGDDEYYTIDGYSNANPDTLTLDRAYVEATATVKGYKIFQNLYSLNAEVGQIQEIVDLTTGKPLERVNIQWLANAFPERATVGPPKVWAPAGRDSNDIQQIELYPVQDAIRSYEYRYIQEAPYVEGGDAALVPQVFESLLRHGWLANYWSWRSRQDDATGQENAWFGQEELLFQKELNEMVARESQNMLPQKLKLARRFTRHRALRSLPYRSFHSADELP